MQFGKGPNKKIRTVEMNRKLFARPTTDFYRCAIGSIEEATTNVDGETAYGNVVQTVLV